MEHLRYLQFAKLRVIKVVGSCLLPSEAEMDNDFGGWVG